MRYLIDELWFPFQQGDSNKGKRFENMVARLLQYSGDGDWVATRAGGDGARDFVRLSNSRQKWAECKIHGRPLSLRVLSPTLVMAVIEEIDEILFFSKTNITAPSLAYLSNFARDTKRRIRIYDDLVLENAILSHTELLKEFFPTFIPPEDFVPPVPLIGVALVKDVDIPVAEGLNNCPNFDGGASASKGHWMWTGLQARTLDGSDSEASSNGLPSLDFNEVFALDIHIRNTDPHHHREFSIDWTFPSEVHFQRLMGGQEAPSPDGGTLAPGEILRRRYLYRAIRPAEKAELPRVAICFNDGPTITAGHAEAAVHSRLCPPLVGDTHLNIVSSFKQKCVYGAQRARLFCIHGKAGTGKSRLLKEIRDEVMVFGQDVTVINGEDQGGSTFNAFIRRIMASAYRLPLVNFKRRSEFDGRVQSAEAASDEIAISKLLYDPGYVPADHVEDCVDLLLSLPSRRNLTVLVDNIQDFDDNTIDFLSQIMVRLAGVHKPLNLVLVFNTDRTAPGTKAAGLHHSLGEMAVADPDFFSFSEVGDLRPEEARHLVNECINWEATPDVDGMPVIGPEVFELVLKDRTLRPLFIIQFLFYLIDLRALDYHVGRLAVLNPLLLQDALRDVPDRIQDLFDKRWQLIRANSPFCSHLEEIVALLALCGSIGRGDLFKMGIERDASIALLDTGFLCLEFGQLRFYHHELFEYFSGRIHRLETALIEKSKVRLETAKVAKRYWVGYFLALAHLFDVNDEAVHFSLKEIQRKALLTPYNYKQFLKLLYELLDEPWGMDSPGRIEANLLVCEEIKRYVSYREGLAHYRHAYKRVKKQVETTDQAFRKLGAFTVEYANAHFAVHLEVQALPALDNCRQALAEGFSSLSPENRRALAAIDNRRSVSLKYLHQFAHSTQAAKDALRCFIEAGGGPRELFDGHVDYSNALKENPACTKGVLRHWRLALEALGAAPANDLPTYIHGAAAFTQAQVMILEAQYDEAFSYAGAEAELCKKRYDHYNAVNLYVTQIVAAVMGRLDVGMQVFVEILNRAEDVCVANAVVRFPWVLAHLRAKIYRMEGQRTNAAIHYVLAMKRLHSIDKYNDADPMDEIHEYFYREYAAFFAGQDDLMKAYRPLEACRAGLRPWIKRILDLAPEGLAAFVAGWVPLTIYSFDGEDLPSV